MAQYDIDLGTVISEIRKNKARRVLLQLPDGLRPGAKEIEEEIKKKTGATVLLWAGSSFGACDLPIGIDKLGVDLVFHFGHTPWKR